MTESPTTPPAAEPKGIGGWLILPVLWTIVSPLVWAYGLFQSVDAVIKYADRDQNGTWTYAIIGEAIAEVAMIAGWIVALVMLFRYKRKYSGLFISLLVATFVIGLIEAVVAAKIFDQELGSAAVRDVGRSFIAMVIWGAYMHESKRVKNTFVN